MNDALPYSSDIGQIIEPDAIHYSFNTMGWYLIGMLALLVLLIYTIVQWRRYIKNAYRRNALKAIKNIMQMPHADTSFEINRILKIICIKLFGRREVAALHGEEWFAFLQSKIKANGSVKCYNTTHFAKAIYNPNTDDGLDDFNHFAAFWINNHHA